MKLLPCAVRGVLASLMISIGGYVYLGCENRVVGAVFFTVGLITITLFGFDLYTGKTGYWLGQSRQERWQTLLSLPCNAVGCLVAGLARKPAGAVLALCEARMAKAPLILLVDGIFCGILTVFHHFFSNSFAASFRYWRIDRCWGQAASHLPQPVHSEALPWACIR